MSKCNQCVYVVINGIGTHEHNCPNRNKMYRRRKRHYVGINGASRVLFTAVDTPTVKSHGAMYSGTIGPFHTKRGAIAMIVYGNNNPHMRCVADAERIGKQNAAELSKHALAARLTGSKK